MKLIINASNLKTTGVVQVAVSFITECIRFNSNEYYIFMSKTVSEQISPSRFPANFTFYSIPDYPQHIIKGLRIRRLLAILESKIKPDCVFSVFGPSWWTPKAPNVMGYALAHYLYHESPIFSILSLKERFRIKLLSIVHKYLFKKNGCFYVCETEDASRRLIKFLTCSEDHVFTVSNTYNHYFATFHPSGSLVLPPKSASEFRILIMSTFVTHKNITILNKVIPLLKTQLQEIEVVFILTVDNQVLHEKMSKEVLQSMVNLGRLPVSKCPSLYYECDALFLPTLMECFSANFPEAMIMNKPILTSNLPFCTEVCKDAALYCDPLDPYDIVEKIIRLVKDQNLRDSLVKNGRHRLRSFDTAETRAKKYLEICENILRIKAG